MNFSMPWQTCRILITVLISIGLLLAPAQAAMVSLAPQAMEMGTETCPKKPTCCDSSKSMRTCTDAAVCSAKCGGAAGFALQDGNEGLAFTAAVIKSP